MKKIKRTIRVRKVEFISNQTHNHEINAEICPLCHSPLPAVKTSAVEISAADVPKIIKGDSESTENDEKKKD